MNVEQAVADWFRNRLARITRADGYSITLNQASIFIDGDPHGEQDPPAPYAKFDDDSSELTNVGPQGDQGGVTQYVAVVIVTVEAHRNTYKRIGRQVHDDVIRACSFGQWDDDDKPPSVFGIVPVSFARKRQEGGKGNYMEVAVTFNISAGVELKSRA